MTRKCWVLCLATCVLGMAFRAQETHPQEGLDAEALKKANSPMASTKAWNLQNYFVSPQYGIEDATLNQLLFRYAQPIGQVLIRVIMPIITLSRPQEAPNAEAVSVKRNFKHFLGSIHSSEPQKNKPI